MFIIKCKTCGNETDIEGNNENEDEVYITDFTSSPYSTKMYAFYCERCKTKYDVHCE